MSLHVRFDMVEQENLSDLLSFIFETPAIHQSDWDGQVRYTVVMGVVKCCYIYSG